MISPITIFQRYLAALSDVNGTMKKTVLLPALCDEKTIQSIELKTCAVIERVKTNTSSKNMKYEYHIQGSELAISLAMISLEDATVCNKPPQDDKHPMTPASKKASKSSRRLSTALQASLKKTNHRGNYTDAPVAVREAIASCMLDEEKMDDVDEVKGDNLGRPGSVIYIEDDDGEGIEYVVIDSDSDGSDAVPVFDHSDDNNDDVVVIEVPENLSMWTPVNESTLVNTNTETSKRKERLDTDKTDVESITEAMQRLKTPSTVKARKPKIQRISAVVRPLVFASTNKKNGKESDETYSDATPKANKVESNKDMPRVYVTGEKSAKGVSASGRKKVKLNRKRKILDDEELKIDCQRKTKQTKISDVTDVPKEVSDSEKRHQLNKEDENDRKKTLEKMKQKRSGHTSNGQNETFRDTERQSDEMLPYKFYGTGSVKDIANVNFDFSRMSSKKTRLGIPPTLQSTQTSDMNIAPQAYAVPVRISPRDAREEQVVSTLNVREDTIVTGQHVDHVKSTRPVNNPRLRYIVVDGSNVAMR